jgi:hypothetical protein
MSNDNYAADARADVNQDGLVNGADILAIRSPDNWNKPVRPTDVPQPPPAERQRIVYAGTDQDACALDVRASNRLVQSADITSTSHGVMNSAAWKTAGLTLRDCLIETIGYGIYSECEGLSILGSRIHAQLRDPIRIAGGRSILVQDCQIDPVSAAVAVRVHDNARDVMFHRVKFRNANPWCADLGEQYRGAGGVVNNVIFVDCEFQACPQTVMAVRVRAQNVVVRNCRGIGFDKALPGAVLVSVERHSCDPIGCRIEGCSIDGNKQLVGQRWSDTVVV